MPPSAAARRNRSRRSMNGHDRGTRERLLETAGQVFAEKGVDRATGKEICARAKTNVAAINYHFGSFDGLYEAVLCEAHRRLATVESIEAAVTAARSLEAKLESVFRLIVTSLSGPMSSSWVVRVLGREIVSPSPAISVL
ncbi:MAG TPA: TetR family transcriptional regulator, partial [Tepidisphaeraceae bacterium]|nr:TetR family transcriptional regulator [Tepidisphaeraceae bacterium]